MAVHGHVLVGYDGTRGSELALRWAVAEARSRGLPLTVCHAWHWPYPAGHVDLGGVAIVRRTGEHLLQRGVDIAESLAPGLRVRPVLTDGPASSALLREAGDGLIVIGSRERDELSMGSAALQVPARAHGPAMVVRDPGGGTEGRVVVGVDGSAGADAALEFAFEEAALRGWTLEALYGYWEPGGMADIEITLFADRDRLERLCCTRLRRAVAPWADRYPQVDVRNSLVEEEPRQALLAAAKGADLLVVGDRGVRGLHPQILGGTTLAMLQLAPCTVAVVHPAERRPPVSP
ncbi:MULTISPECIES: universal stress protein [Thermomonospora]|uniref:UspA domain protein n=1 Tax=Thermomonospora curvata (strain ATCC 19995 / DSM 43183 / JCM 3096 / KCTC 9072 / NBRC 15933 / NCIMB 10081 / Henssen B9) TaxID=471852 RepID=D1AEL8_THECD|nr:MULTISPECIES: universal stress protein [Thermomonospora]ACY97593.1 UspA domain protein [Thermomonospora curvata DSM 43183]PKK14539.1 MAG: universal stress protein [Thermomonospora sp. CIF 1]